MGRDDEAASGRTDVRTIATNRKAHFDYHILDRLEAGIALQGTEVKSLRAGNVTLKDSYVDLRNGEMILVGTHISPYEAGNRNNHEPERERKLLLHKREILKWGQRAREKGLTLVPLRLYFKSGKVKVEVALVKGKRFYDKRDAIAARESKREVDRARKEGRGR